MPPQPLSRIKPGIKYRIFFDNLDHQSSTAQAMAECIGKWSVVDTCLGYLFISLLQANERRGAELYAALESAKAKSTAIKALSVASLNAEEDILLSRLLKYTSSQQKIRDKIAHWMIGTSDDLPKSLIMVDPKTAWSAMGDSREIYRNAIRRQDGKKQ